MTGSILTERPNFHISASFAVTSRSCVFAQDLPPEIKMVKKKRAVTNMSTHERFFDFPTTTFPQIFKNAILFFFLGGGGFANYILRQVDSNGTN